MNSNHANLGHATLINHNIFVSLMLSTCYFSFTLQIKFISIRRKKNSLGTLTIFVKANVSVNCSPDEAIKALVKNANQYS